MAKKAVLIGCNYPGMGDAELRGCVNDVRRIYGCLIDRYGFLKEDITVMIDTDPSYTQPTGENINLELSKLVASAKADDVLFIHYSGHGLRDVSDVPEKDDTGYDECIVPTDGNIITDDHFKELVAKVPTGCKVTIVSDSCHSGGLIEGAVEQIGESTKKPGKPSRSLLFCSPTFDANAIPYSYVKFRSIAPSTLADMLKQKTGKDDIDVGNLRSALLDIFGEHASLTFKKSGKSRLHGGNSGMVGMQEAYSGSIQSSLVDRGILLSTCQSDQGAAEATLSENSTKAYGAFSNVMQATIKVTDDAVTNRKLIAEARIELEKQGFPQKPGLYCSDDHVDDRFIL